MKHRAFRADRFVAVVEPAQLQRLAESHGVSPTAATRFALDTAAFESYLDQNDDSPTVELGETVHRINDISESSSRFVINEYRRNGIAFDAQHATERLACRLYLDYRESFEDAWSNFVLFGTSARLASFRMPQGLHVAPEPVALFAEAVRGYFARAAKGEACQVIRSDTDPGVVVRINHGLHMQTLQYWDEGRPKFQSLRPAQEDILFYEARTGLLHIRATSSADRDAYLLLFAVHVGGDADLALDAARDPLYTLLPLSRGTFCFDGDGKDIFRVDLRSVRMRVFGRSNTVARLSARDLRTGLAEDLDPFSLASGEILEARFWFHLWPPTGARSKVAVTIKPPDRTFLTQASYSDLIDRYLEAQGVRIP